MEKEETLEGRRRDKTSKMVVLGLAIFLHPSIGPGHDLAHTGVFPVRGRLYVCEELDPRGECRGYTVPDRQIRRRYVVEGCKSALGTRPP